jgi:hypothetical protein
LGDPTIEFYEDKKTVARLVVIHGDVLRWPGGWPEDAPLVEASADYIAKWLSDHGVAKWLSDHGHGLAEWLSDHGVKGAKVEDKKLSAKKNDQALELCWKRWFAALPDEVDKRLQKAENTEEMLAALEDRVKDGPGRARLYLRLWGVGETSWDYYGVFGRLLQERLCEHVCEADIAAALKLILRDEDQEGIRGLARWLFGEYEDGEIKPKIVALAIRSAASAGLGSPWRDNRRRTINVLHMIGTREAVAALRECLADKIKVRKLPQEQGTEPDSEVKEACSDRAHAALCLAKLGDTQSLAAIIALHKEAKGEDRKVLDKALGLLKAAKKKE